MLPFTLTAISLAFIGEHDLVDISGMLFIFISFIPWDIMQDGSRIEYVSLYIYSMIWFGLLFLPSFVLLITKRTYKSIYFVNALYSGINAYGGYMFITSLVQI